jgi:penicillin amidase
MATMGLWVRRILGLVLGLFIVVIASAYVYLRGSLPKYEGDYVVSGLQEEVRVTRDALGVVTVTAGRREDAMRALGYVHGQERFFEMDLMRRAAAGELSELLGALTLPVDRRNRMHRFRARAQLVLSQFTPAQRRDVGAYVDGVNAGLQALRARPFPYALLRQAPRAWQAEDVPLVILTMFLDLNDSSNARELARGKMKQYASPALFALLNAQGTIWDAPLEGEALPMPPLPTAEELDLRQIDRRWFGLPVNLGAELAKGSNNFAVDGTLSDTGAALVANDMHLSLRVPNIWFRARLQYTDAAARRVDVSGLTLPGVPGVAAGSNGKVAWTFTNSFGDWLDWVDIDWLDATKTDYRVGDSTAKVSVYDETILVRHASPEILRVRETLWGPIIHDLDAQHSLALNWTAHHPQAVNLNLNDLESAHNIDQAIAIAHRSGMPPQNFVVGDALGNIAWTIIGAIPSRQGFDPTMPARFNQSSIGWTGWVSSDQYPLIRNPDSHRLWTANARVAAGNNLALLGDGGYALGVRAFQIRDQLMAKQQFTPADMLAIQLDDRSLLLRRWYDLLRQTLGKQQNNPHYDELTAATERWDERASVDAVAYRLTRAFRVAVSSLVLDGLAAPIRSKTPDFQLPALNQSEDVVWQLIEQQPPHLLAPIYPDWDALLKTALDQVVQRYADLPGGLDQRNWGERNTSQIKHPISKAIPVLGWLLDMPYRPLPGDTTTPRVQTPTNGASERFAVSPGHEEQGILHMPGGQSGHPLSPYYGAGHEDWEQGRPTPFLPGQAQHQLRLVPIN